MRTLQQVVWPHGRRIAGCRLRSRIAVIIVAIAAVTALPAASARADLPVSRFQALVQGITENDGGKMGALQYYLRGLLDGLAELNAAYVKEGARPGLCVPRDPHPPFAEIVVAIQQELEMRQNYWIKDPARPVEPIAILALKRKWPCRR